LSSIGGDSTRTPAILLGLEDDLSDRYAVQRTVPACVQLLELVGDRDELLKQIVVGRDLRHVVEEIADGLRLDALLRSAEGRSRLGEVQWIHAGATHSVTVVRSKYLT
jgi:hypothetical protein